MSDNQIVIIGGGLQGLATAFTLLQRGEEVLILERDSDVATSASFANAGMLTPSQSSPWNSPDDILQILTGIGKKDSPMAMSPFAIPTLISWGLKFLINSTPKRFNRITSNLYTLGSYSKDLTKDFREKFNLSYEHSERGTLKIYRRQENFDKAVKKLSSIFTTSISSLLILNTCWSSS